MILLGRFLLGVARLRRFVVLKSFPQITEVGVAEMREKCCNFC